jgi:3-oxoacyl-[acyl-carrier-protein] synthase-3
MASERPGSQIIGTGAYAPEKVLTNQDLARIVDTSDEWIRERTGIAERRIASDGEAASDMAYEASRRALEAAGIEPTDVDRVLDRTDTVRLTGPDCHDIVPG